MMHTKLKIHIVGEAMNNSSSLLPILASGSDRGNAFGAPRRTNLQFRLQLQTIPFFSSRPHRPTLQAWYLQPKSRLNM